MIGFNHHFRDGEELVGGVERLEWMIAKHSPHLQKVWKIFNIFRDGSFYVGTYAEERDFSLVIFEM